ncbi:hypothetical protein NST74_24340 [Paenibacillus sp. FSL F4-0125]|uniref:hypothetical protein n=1 Tax=Paenibacillus sp. FSL F4-0125 TaxID=2954730 RepID=UPI0030F67228
MSEGNNYLQYKLRGFNNLNLQENKEYPINNELIESLKISDDLTLLHVYLKDNILYDKHSNKIETYLNHICFNLIVHSEASISQPVRWLEFDSSNRMMNDAIRIRDSFTFFRNISAENVYNKIVNSPTALEKHYLKYERIFKTLHNPNQIVQFMSLYQFLMELLSSGKEKVEQKNVTQYLRRNKKKYPFIGFELTRRKGHNFKEDSFTLLRNEIGHSEETNDLNLYESLGEKIDQSIIKKLILVLNDVIIKLP